MRQHSRHILAVHQLGDAVEAPAGREVGMLVEEVAPVVDLELVNPGAEFDIPLGLFHALLELEHPQLIVLVQTLIQFLQSREQCTRRLSNHQIKLITFQRFPASISILLAVEIIAALYVRSCSTRPSACTQPG